MLQQPLTKKTPDCIIEVWYSPGKGQGTQVYHNVKGVYPFWDTVAFFKVYYTEAYKKQLEDEFQYSY